MKRHVLRLLALILLLASMQAADSAQRPMPQIIELDEKADDGYTINFRNVSMKEFLHFISKIANVNFVYNEDEVNFNITFISEEQASLSNVMAAFTQILQINNLDLVEDGDNLIIHSNGSIKQIPTVVSEELPFTGDTFPPYVTRVFNVMNSDPQRLVNLIRPMLSTKSLVEVVPDARKFIVTDNTSNVNQIARLLVSIDVPAFALELGTFQAVNNDPAELISLVDKIMKPLSDDAPLVMIEQPNTNLIYIISTDYLLDQTQMLLKELDGNEKVGKNLSTENVLIYHLQYKTASQVETALKQVADDTQSMGFQASSLIKTIDAMRYLKSTNSLMFIGEPKDIERIKVMLKEIDALSQVNADHVKGSFFIYTPTQLSPSDLVKLVKETAQEFQESGLADTDFIACLNSAKVMPDSKSVAFTGSASSINELKTLLPSIDTYGAGGPSSFFVYKLQKAPENQIKATLKDFIAGLEASPNPDQALIATLKSMKWEKETNSIIFTGPVDTLKQVKELIPSLDVSGARAKSAFYLYQVKDESPAVLQRSIEQFVTNLKAAKNPDQELISALQSMKYDSKSQSMMFTGSESAIAEVKEIMPTLDNPLGADEKTDFFMYTPKNVQAEDLAKNIKDLAQSLSKSGLEDPSLISSLESVRYIPSSHNLVFTGKGAVIPRVKEIVASMDGGDSGTAISKGLLIFTPKYATKEQVETALNRLVADSPSNSPERKVVDNMTYLAHSHSFIFRGSNSALKTIKEVLDATDIPGRSSDGKTYSVYKLKYMPGDLILRDLDRMARNLKSSGVKEQNLVKTIQNIEWVKSTNSLFITGNKSDITKIQELISEFDVPSGDGQQAPSASSFYIYKPKYMSAQELQASLQSIEEDFEKSGLADEQFMKTLSSMRYAQATQSLIFTGTDQSITKVKGLIAEIDVESKQKAPIQHIGQTTFLIYKIKYASPSYLQNSLKQMANDLEENKGTNKDLIHALRTNRYVSETHSLIFTGTQKTLERVQDILEKFDVEAHSATPARPPTAGYLIYKPKYINGEELIGIMHDFESNLKSTGVNDPTLFDVINNLKWMDKTQSILVSGKGPDSEKVISLLEKFDLPGKALSGKGDISDLEDFSFLVYRVQYHNGEELVSSLKAIGRGFTGEGKTKSNENLVNAINTIQWVQMTNSLIATGDPQSLSRLRELLKGLDVPLKQVFIEVLVIQTTPIKKLDFGLRWASQGKYRDRFGYAFANNPATSNSGPADFSNNLYKINATRTPTGTDVPSLDGGSLGVIGDIILHKGKSYFALGSLLTAIQEDNDTTVVLDQQIVAQDNLQSSLFVGSNIPFSGSTITFTGQVSQRSENLEYRDIGVTLNVTPNIGDDDVITLDIYEEITATNPDEGSSDDAPSSNDLTPETAKTSMQTKVHVPDKHFVMVSGMIRDSTVRNTVGLPCLGGLPIIGAAFSERNYEDTKESVVMFIRPHILKNSQIFKEVTETQEDKYREVAGGPGGMEDYDRGIEYVRSPEDG